MGELSSLCQRSGYPSNLGEKLDRQSILNKTCRFETITPVRVRTPLNQFLSSLPNTLATSGISSTFHCSLLQEIRQSPHELSMHETNDLLTPYIIFRRLVFEDFQHEINTIVQLRKAELKWGKAVISYKIAQVV